MVEDGAGDERATIEKRAGGVNRRGGTGGAGAGVGCCATASDPVIVNAAPLLAALPNQTVDPLTLVQFTAIATDPSDILAFSLNGAPSGAKKNATCIEAAPSTA